MDTHVSFIYISDTLLNRNLLTFCRERTERFQTFYARVGYDHRQLLVAPGGRLVLREGEVSDVHASLFHVVAVNKKL